jgi:MFS family permease
MLGDVRRLLIFVSVVVFADTMLFSAIIPLIPFFADEYALSKLGAGLLVGAYGAGAVIGGIPAGIVAARIGPKRTVVLGLFILAVASIAFAFGSSPAELGIARFAQGFASVFTWAGALAWLTLSTPRERRGQTLGTAFSFAVLGFIIGPAIGALAELTSVEGVFIAIAIATGALGLTAAAFPAGRFDVQQPNALRQAFRDVGFLTAVWLTLVPALFFGLLDVLVPLTLDESGWGTVAIAFTFIGAGLIEVALGPVIGGISDRRGRLYPIRAALMLLAVVALAFAIVTPAALIALLVVAASLAASGIYAPGIALVSDRAEANQMPQTLAFGVMNTAWAIGAMTGPSAGGALAQAIGDPAPYLICAVIAVATLVVVGRAGLAPSPA